MEKGHRVKYKLNKLENQQNTEDKQKIKAIF